MRVLRVAVVFVFMLGLAGCASGPTEDIIMPEVSGQRLDIALSDIERAGFSDEVEVVGGGLLGVLDESNWEVCEQTPNGGEAVTAAPRLIVERSCGGDDPAETEESAETEDPAPSEESDPSEPSDTPSGVDAAAIEAKFNEHLHNNFIESVDGMCDDAYTHWACFYDGVQGAPGYLRILLSTDGGWSESELSEMADATGRHWFNFIGCDFPDLDTIVVTINGLDHNVFRSETNADAMCS